MKKNSKGQMSKKFDTMLDVICDYQVAKRKKKDSKGDIHKATDVWSDDKKPFNQPKSKMHEIGK